MAQLQGRPLPTRLRLEKGFQPCPTETGDGMYPNGTSAFAYEKYVEYWNDKVRTLLGDLRGQSKSSET